MDQEDRPRVVLWLVAGFLLLYCPALILFWFLDAQASKAREEIQRAVEGPDNSFAVTINGRSARDGAALLHAIRGIHSQPPHHSSPGPEIQLVIRGPQSTLALTLARDSKVPREYWAFWTQGASNPNRLEIGRIDTSVLDSE